MVSDLSGPLPVVILESEEASIARQLAEQEARSREEADLVAQEGMNAATERMAKYAFWQTLLVAVGTAALIYTLWLTQRANASAQGAADAAWQMVQMERAWLTISKVDWAIIHNSTVQMSPDPDDLVHVRQGFAFWVCVQNSGRSPATNVEIEMLQKIVPVAVIDPPDFGAVFKEGPSVGVVGPGLIAESLAKSADDDDAIAIVSHEKVVFIKFRATYRTIQKPEIERRTEAIIRLRFAGFTETGGARKVRFTQSFISSETT